MSENSKNLKNLSLKLSKEDYINYKEELEKIMKGKKDEYSDLNEIFESFNQKKIHLSFLLFSHYNKWIFPSISHNNIISFNSCSSESSGGYPRANAGDIDGDGSITAADAMLALRFSMRLIELTGARIIRGDIDGDGWLTPSDAVLILRLSMHLI